MNKDKKQLIVFMGLATTGKDYNAKPYVDAGFKKMSFADPLREMLWGILGFTPNKEMSYDDFKSSNLTAEVKHKILGFIPNYKDINIATGRKLLQNLGSVIKANFGETYWANRWYKDVLENDEQYIIVDDARFPYEIKKAMSLEKKGYKVDFIWCQYEKANYEKLLEDKHESESLAQFIYINRDKYYLYDTCLINTKNMNKILKDYNRFLLTTKG